MHVEPLLAAIALLFDGIMQRRKQTLEEIRQFWAQHGLDEHTLAERAAIVINDKTLLAALSGTAQTRLVRLLAVAQTPTFAGQVAALLDYHQFVMQSRGQLPWMTLCDETLTLQVPTRALRTDSYRDGWVNGYYIPQFRHLLQDLWGAEQ